MMDWTVKESFDRLLSARAKRKYAPATQKNIAVAGRRLAEYFGEDFPVRDITEAAMEAFLAERNAKLLPSSANKEFDQILIWLEFTGRNEGPGRELVENWRRPPKPVTEDRVYVPRSAVPHVLEVAGNRDPRDRMLVALFWYTGIRAVESTYITIGDIDTEHGEIRVRRPKVRDVLNKPIEPGLLAELDRWLPYYAEHAQPTTLPRKDWALIPSTTPGGTQSSIWRGYMPHRAYGKPRQLITPILAEAGFAGRRLGASSLRHSSAEQLHESLVAEGYVDALSRVKEFLGHALVSTTEGYLNRRTGEARARQTAGLGLLTPSEPTRVALAPVISIMSRRRTSA